MYFYIFHGPKNVDIWLSLIDDQKFTCGFVKTFLLEGVFHTQKGFC